MRAELAQALVELWDEYLASNTMTFQPTMTDFAGWLKDHRPKEESSDTRTGGNLWPHLHETKNPGVNYRELDVNSDNQKLPSVTQFSGDDVIPADVKASIVQLYKDGYTLPRIRSMLKIYLPITRMQTIVKRAKV